MREKWAKRIVFLTALIVIVLAFVFARIQNPDKLTELMQPVVIDSTRIETGRQIYQQQSCGLCHSIAGQGNPRNPLDDVGKKRTASELRNFITGADTLQGVLTTSIRQRKLKYRALSADDLGALVIYMQSL